MHHSSLRLGRWTKQFAPRATAALFLLGGAACDAPVEACDPADRLCLSAQLDSGGGRGSMDAGASDVRGGGRTDATTLPDVSIPPDSGGFEDSDVVAAACDQRSCEELEAAGIAPPDTDADGLPDCVETFFDSDGDGIANCEDPDSDDDGILDEIEGRFDTDGDGTPDYLDLDSDNDNILDQFEGTGDPDEDGIPNFRDGDSDGDGWPDSAEYGHPPGSNVRPIDREGDGQPDYLDLDSDGDGLADSEERGCPISTDRTVADTDNDGYNDLIEVAFSSDACDPEDDISEDVEFYFELPYRGDGQTDELEFGTDVQTGDVVFNMDTTGSMGDEIDRLKSTLTSVIVPALRLRIDNVGMGVSSFDDFPCNGHGSGSDVPFQLHKRITLSGGDAQDALDGLRLHNGNDVRESGFESLYQLATGAGRTGCGGRSTVAAFDPSRDYLEDVRYGWIGGAGFREGALPIVVHITDNASQARGENGYGEGSTRAETYAALSDIGARVITVASGSAARSDNRQMSNETGAVVPPCAWDGACGTDRCCTGSSGGGESPNGDGLCPLAFEVGSNGSGLDDSIVDAIDALLRFTPSDVSIRLRPDPEADPDLLLPGMDTTCFIRSVIPVHAEYDETACTSTPIAADLDGDGINDGYRNVTPGAQLYFQVDAENPDCARPTLRPLVFIAYIDVMGNGVTVLDEQRVSILVPPTLKL